MLVIIGQFRVAPLGLGRAELSSHRRPVGPGVQWATQAGYSVCSAAEGEFAFSAVLLGPVWYQSSGSSATVQVAAWRGASSLSLWRMMHRACMAR
jgi:hypothetical protein